MKKFTLILTISFFVLFSISSSKANEVITKENELEKFRGDFESILEYFDKLKEVNTGGVEEMGHITGMKNVFRKDEVLKVEEDEIDIILENFPSKKDGFIQVKNVL